ncbi:BURP domain-containing protein 6-like isoform X3 [Zingiber officinale]|uniref:BURP domain-containing protein 6-like isoform X2 n=1 Tax=Zingiber officinale TaxID=94328 RepID=UPI001C4DC686|nr:BURP domain-containing protein 6-like isoform X2 [Zingiber officinale]XP_042394199.1 BURP domain-containing protein 6-like isoform X3 [Zingiber officinale]
MSSPPMDRLFVFLPLLSFFLLLRASSDAAMSPQEAYWRTVLPTTPMPSAIADRLSLGATVGSEKTTVSVGKGGVHVNTGKPGRGTTVNVGGVHMTNKKPMGRPDSFRNYGPPDRRPDSFRNYGPPDRRPDSFRNYAATETQIHDDPNAALFFLESNLRPGAAMTVHFTRPSAFRAAFLPRREADAIPFSSARLPEILDRLSIKPGSPEAETTLSTLQECERSAVPGERKLCATSLESMVDFSVANLGTRRVVAASTAVSKAGTPLQTYTIQGVRKTVAAEGRLVACHSVEYAYAVFYCHTSAARAYMVSLVGADGAKVEAVAVCHTDTAGWNPNHMAFKVLKVIPGTVPVCHYLPEDNLVWSRSN